MEVMEMEMEERCCQSFAKSPEFGLGPWKLGGPSFFESQAALHARDTPNVLTTSTFLTHFPRTFYLNMVATRHARAQGKAPPSPTHELADLDAREARRLQTAANLDENGQIDYGLGSYHWRGSVYAIEPHTPQSWIDQGEREYAEKEERKAARLREIKQRQADSLARTEARFPSLSASVEPSKSKTALGKRKVENTEIEQDIDDCKKRKSSYTARKTAATTVTFTKRSSSPPRGSSSSVLKPKPEHTSQSGMTRTRSENLSGGKSTTKRDKESESSAGSNIDVSRAPRRRPTAVHDTAVPPRRPIEEGNNEQSESDSTDIPTSLPPIPTTTKKKASRRRTTTTRRSTTTSRRKSSSKRPFSPKIIANIDNAIRNMAKANSRIDAVAGYIESRFGKGVWKRYVAMLKKQKAGKALTETDRKTLTDVASVVGSDDLQRLLEETAAQEHDDALGDDAPEDDDQEGDDLEVDDGLEGDDQGKENEDMVTGDDHEDDQVMMSGGNGEDGGDQAEDDAVMLAETGIPSPESLDAVAGAQLTPPATDSERAKICP
jgi:hypothetical protein